MLVVTVVFAVSAITATMGMLGYLIDKSAERHAHNEGR